MEFDRQLARHRDAVYRQMVRMCGNADDAEDVLVEAMLAANRAKEGLRNSEAMQAWLVQIGRRACGRLRKRESKHAAIALEQMAALGIEVADPSDSPESLAMETELKDCVRAALLNLRPTYRRAYERIDVAGNSIGEIAAQEGVTIGAMKVRLTRARKQVRNSLDSLIAPMSFGNN